MDLDSDIDSDNAPRRGTRAIPGRAAKTKAPTRSSRLTRASAAYFSSSQSSLSDLDDDNQNNRKRKCQTDKTPANKRPRRNPVRSQVKTPTKLRRRHPLKSRGGHHPNKIAVVDEPDLVLAGEWEALPYLIWCGVFEYVAAPLRDRGSRSEDYSRASHTLLAAACAAKILAEPALKALYKSPLVTPESAHGLCKTLTMGSNTFVNYRPKVETLRIEVGGTVAKKINSKYLELKGLVQNLPRLAHLELYHQLDEAPYRSLDQPIRWTYTKELFEAFEPLPDGNVETADKICHTQLRAWTWNSRMAGHLCSLEKLREIHLTPSFLTLRKVAFVNYQLPSLSSRVKDLAEIAAMDEPVTNHLAAAIAALPRLEHVVFESSTAANASLLEKLPKNLKHVELINCWDVEAESFAEFLLSHGSSLQSLTLNHCQSLSLAFLPVLGSACPNLFQFTMDFRYYRHHEFYKDDDPMYDALLTKKQVPSWPKSIRSIDLQNLGHWEVEAADMLFKSLEKGAASMLDLRRLVLKATLNCPIRQRAEFREYWVERMQHIFKRPLQEPKPVPRNAPANHVRHEDCAQPKGTRGLAVTTSIRRQARRSNRIAKQLSPITPDGEVTQANVSGREIARVSQLSQETKRLRVTSTRKGYVADIESSEDELTATPLSYMSSDGPSFRHILCDVVDIRFDNQKLIENPYAMEDFLDASDAGPSDAEWNSDDEEDLFI